jgi:hypothetical protein
MVAQVELWLEQHAGIAIQWDCRGACLVPNKARLAAFRSIADKHMMGILPYHKPVPTNSNFICHVSWENAFHVWMQDTKLVNFGWPNTPIFFAEVGDWGRLTANGRLGALFGAWRSLDPRVRDALGGILGTSQEPDALFLTFLLIGSETTANWHSVIWETCHSAAANALPLVKPSWLRRLARARPVPDRVGRTAVMNAGGFSAHVVAERAPRCAR